MKTGAFKQAFDPELIKKNYRKNDLAYKGRKIGRFVDKKVNEKINKFKDRY